MSSAARNLEQLLDPLSLQQQTRAPSRTRQCRTQQQATSERKQRRRRLPGCRPQQESFTCRGRGSAAYLLSVSLENPGGQLVIMSNSLERSLGLQHTRSEARESAFSDVTVPLQCPGSSERNFSQLDLGQLRGAEDDAVTGEAVKRRFTLALAHALFEFSHKDIGLVVSVLK